MDEILKIVAAAIKGFIATNNSLISGAKDFVSLTSRNKITEKKPQREFDPFWDNPFHEANWMCDDFDCPSNY